MAGYVRRIKLFSATSLCLVLGLGQTLLAIEPESLDTPLTLDEAIQNGLANNPRITANAVATKNPLL